MTSDPHRPPNRVHPHGEIDPAGHDRHHVDAAARTRHDAGGDGATHGHHHGNAAAGRDITRAFSIALGLCAGFAVVEALGGYFAHSLALISDAGHMVTDAMGLAIALIAARFARRPPSLRASYGYARAEVIAAFVNSIALLALVVWIVVEAVTRLLQPAPVAGTTIVVIAALGMAINLVVYFLLSRTSGGLNVRGAMIHVIGDLLGSVAALVAGAVVLTTGWTPIDPILSIVVALLILRSTVELLTQSTRVLMEGVPPDLSYEAIGRALAALPGVTGVHDLHVWHLSSRQVALSAHLALADGGAWPRTLALAQKMLARDFGIDHPTLQPDWPLLPEGQRVIPLVVAAPPSTGLTRDSD